MENNATSRTMCYAGIGNRQLLDAVDGDYGRPVADVMRFLATALEKVGYTLFSGGAKGADEAFESGVSDSNHKMIFTAKDATDETRTIARANKLPGKNLLGRKLDLYAREVFQIFGADQKTPVDFVLCYTRDGCESHETRSEETGGTGFAIELASRNGIPVINLKNCGWEKRLKEILGEAESYN